MTEPACVKPANPASLLSGTSLPFSEMPGTSKLFLDFIYNFEAVGRFYRNAGRNNSSLKELATKVVEQTYPRDVVADALLDQNRKYGAGSAALGNIELLRKEQSVAVVAGQQAGLFTGPLFSILKALTAIRISENLRKEGIAAVPVFWVASEDHDFAEVDHCSVIGRDGALREIQYSTPEATPAQPAGNIVLTEAIAEQLSSLEESLADLPHTAEVLSLLRKTYSPGSGFVAAFSATIAQLLSDFGLVVLDPFDARLKKAAGEVFVVALRRSEELAEALVLQSDELVRSGYHAQVRVSRETVPVFLIHRGERVALVRDGDRFHVKGRRDSEWTADELLGLVAAGASELSPNVMLRPVIQDTLLPTIAYVGGPAEVAYFAQLRPLYSLFGRFEPCIIPRASATLLDSQTRRTLEKFDLRLQDFFRSRDAVERMIVERVLSQRIAREFEETSSAMNEAITRLRDSLREFDPTLATSLENRRPKIQHHIEHVRNSYAREYAQRDHSVKMRVSAAASTLYPNRKLQEREVNVFSFIARSGFGIIDDLYRSIESGYSGHTLIPVGP